jgi:hypothetical protein
MSAEGDRAKVTGHAAGSEFATVEVRLRLEEFLTQIPDKRLGEIFAGASLARMESALIERSIDM